MKRLLLLLLLMAPLIGFRTLEQVAAYALSVNETPPIENENVLNPRFDKYHASIAPSSMSRFLHWLGLYRLPWVPTDLEKVVAKLLAHKKGAQTRTLSVTQGTEFIVIGPLFGAYHSLVRILQDLKARDLLDNNLTLKKNHYLIFAGNVIDGSPYTLETLTLVLNLLASNQDRVMYLQGTHEHETFWLNHGLKYELQQRASFKTLKPLLTELFARLPHELTIKLAHDNNYLQIANLPRSEDPDEAMKALIKAEQRNVSYTNHPGITQLQPNQNTTVWSVFSAPTTLYQTYYQFFHLLLLSPCVLRVSLHLHSY